MEIRFRSERALPALQLCGPDLSAKRALAAALAGRLTIELFRLPVAALPTNLVELENLHRLWEREAILQNAALLLECDRSESGEAVRELAIDRWIELTRTPLLVSSREPRRDLERPLFTVDVAKPTRAEQRLAWEEAIGAGRGRAEWPSRSPCFAIRFQHRRDSEHLHGIVR